MNLQTLMSLLIAAADDTDIERVFFDYTAYLTYGLKAYPLVIWDVNNLSGTADLHTGQKIINLDCWCVHLVEPDDDVNAKLAVWDAIEADMQAYVLEVNGAANLSVENIKNIPYEYFPAGILSPEREMAVKYRVTLKMWC
jgi:hypothetical protein